MKKPVQRTGSLPFVSCRFKDISITGGKGFTADWNPCTKWTEETPQSVKHNNCQNTAVSLPDDQFSIY